ncbi:hypothetical protein J4729_18765 [Leisingera sp. HS039]|uniref:hypothetical protein n=1 Tax=Leisingera sp. HS039 TaxID=2818496 RepID=UPI001B39EA5B|nr:hypothetical protein [Leisingera sp. HS039]MBQ4826570.1 hypothetical protein [Leisingera sp. HS039]
MRFIAASIAACLPELSSTASDTTKARAFQPGPCHPLQQQCQTPDLLLQGRVSLSEYDQSRVHHVRF